MNLQTWLEINAFIGLFFGVVLILRPQKMMARFGALLDSTSLIFVRGVGGGMLGLALVNWSARNYTALNIVWAVVGANILIHLVGGLADTKATLDGTYKKPAVAWASVGFHALIAAVFAYFYLFTR